MSKNKPATRKPYIVHYHLYKNAGSSIDASLRDYFGADALIELDKDPLTKDETSYDTALIDRLIDSHPQYRCFSAHRMIPDIHLRADFPVYPIVFLRHPLLRVASVYRFERARTDGWLPAKVAKALDFENWLNWAMYCESSLEAKNYQTAMLTMGSGSGAARLTNSPTHLFDIDVARNRLEQSPIVGIVEKFDQTSQKIAQDLESHFPGIHFTKEANITKRTTNWKDELTEIESSLSKKSLQRFKVFNAQDYELFYEHYDNTTRQ